MLRLSYITNDPEVALIAEEAGVDWIFVDWEYRGKSERQAGRDTVVSRHSADDLARIRKAVTKAKILVRINPLGSWTSREIDQAVNLGADFVMLPYFSTVEEVDSFIELLDGRAKAFLLLETLAAIDNLSRIVRCGNVEYVHVGLNDIHIQRQTRFMFEFLADGGVDKVANILHAAGIPFGFGGIAKIGALKPPAERILAEHYRLGSSGVILSRSFHSPDKSRPVEPTKQVFISEVAIFRATELEISRQKRSFFQENKVIVERQINEVAESIGSSIDGR